MTTNTQPQTQQSGGDELENYFVETIARYTNAPRIPELAAMLARYVQARERAAEKRGLERGKEILHNYWDWSAMSDIIDDDFEAAIKALTQPKPQAGEGGEG